MKTRSPMPLYWTLSGLLIASTCDDGGPVGTQPLSRDDVVGTYLATTLLVTLVTTEIDLLAEGGILSVTLEPAGTTTGTLLIPEGVAGEEQSVDLSGTWGFQPQGPTVTFEQDADTFVRDLTFEVTCADDGTVQLRTEEAVSDNLFRIVLSRIPTVQFPVTTCLEG